MSTRSRFRPTSYALLLAAALVASGRDASAVSWSMGVHFENDLFADSDQLYTNGIKLTLVSPDLTSRFREREELPGWARRLIPHIPLIREKGAARTLAFSLGQNIYTPQDIETSSLVATDRPYGGWLYFGTTFQTRDLGRQDTFDVQVGMIGPFSFAEQTQELVHRVRDVPIARGWNNQLRTEPGIVLAYERVFRVALGGSPGGLSADLLPSVGGAVGNVATYASAGVQLRAGWNVPPDFGYAVIRPGGVTQVDSLRDVEGRASADAAHREALRRRGFSAYLFAGAGGRGVLRDVFVDGNSFRGSHSVDREPFVVDFMAGATLAYGGVKLSLAKVVRTREFRGQPRDHRFGSVTLTYAF